MICNNQVGFTAHPEQGRSTMYASDLGKTFGVPIFHVNADDPEAVQRVFELSTQWRQQFRTDVVIDLVGYRKNGHNEIDEPTFTHPTMYQAIKRHKTPLAVYKERLLAEGSFTQDEIDGVLNSVEQAFQDAFVASETYETPEDNWKHVNWKHIRTPNEGQGRFEETGLAFDQLRRIGAALDHTPEGFAVHKRLDRQLKAKSSMFVEGNENTTADGAGVDWATAEALAFGGCLLEDHAVRFTGQDVERGTFSHRHAVATDQKTGEKHVFLNHIATAPGEKEPAKIFIENSPLSECVAERAVLRARARGSRRARAHKRFRPPLPRAPPAGTPCSATSSATRWRRPTCSSCGRRSSATSSTARRSSSTSSSRRARPSGCASRGS